MAKFTISLVSNRTVSTEAIWWREEGRYTVFLDKELRQVYAARTEVITTIQSEGIENEPGRVPATGITDIG